MDICSVCSGQFDNEQAYLDHVCTTGYNPTQPENLGVEFSLISRAAVARGDKREELEATGVAPEVAQAQAAEIVAEQNMVVQ